MYNNILPAAQNIEEAMNFAVSLKNKTKETSRRTKSKIKRLASALNGTTENGEYIQAL